MSEELEACLKTVIRAGKRGVLAEADVRRARQMLAKTEPAL